jgi:anti-anti-sigma regulatory factor
MAEACTVAIHRLDSGCLLRVEGRGTLRESPAVRDFACCAIENGADVFIDLSACDYLDSTFLGCLVILHERGTNSDGSFAVVADEDARRKLLHKVRLDRVLTFVSERPPCLGPPVPLKVSALERTDFCRHLLETHRKLAELGGPAADTFRGIAQQLAKELDSLRA